MTAFIFALGLLVRFFMLISEKSFWGDEWFSIGLAKQPLINVFWGSIHDVHPPLYFLALHLFVRAFGEAEVVYRLVSFLSGVGTLITIYFLTKTLFDKTTARVAGLFVALSPYWLQSSNEVRSYSLLAFVSSLAIYFFVKILQHPSRQRWCVGYSLALSLSVYVEHYAWFLLMGFTTSIGWIALCKKSFPKKIILYQEFILALSLPALFLAAYQAFFTEHVFDVSRIQEYWRLSILLKKIIGLFWHFSCGYLYSMLTVERIQFYVKTSAVFWLSALLSLCSVSVAIRALVECYKKQKEVFILFLMSV